MTVLMYEDIVRLDVAVDDAEREVKVIEGEGNLRDVLAGGGLLEEADLGSICACACMCVCWWKRWDACTVSIHAQEAWAGTWVLAGGGCG